MKTAREQRGELRHNHLITRFLKYKDGCKSISYHLYVKSFSCYLPIFKWAFLPSIAMIRISTATISFSLLSLLFLATAEYYDINQDCIVAALPAWKLVNSGSFILDEFSHYPGIAPARYGNMSIVAPMLQLFSVPFYLIFPSEHPTAFPSTLAAVFATTLSLIIFYNMLSAQVAKRTALAACLVLALCTPVWGVAAKQLWSHPVNILWIAAALNLLSRDRKFGAGICFALLVLTRQITVLIPVVIVAFMVLSRRDLKEQLRIILPVTAAIALLMVYNLTVWTGVAVQPTGFPSSDLAATIAGGYQPMLSNLSSLSIQLYLRRTFELFFSPDIGIFIWSPFIFILTLGLIPAWKESSFLFRASFVSAIFYLLAHITLNRTSGGMVFNYRYPLESLILATPLLVNSYIFWVNKNGLRRKIFFLSVIVSLLIQACYAVNYYCVKDEHSPEGKVSCYMF